MTNKTISLQDICEKCTYKEQEHFIDMTDFYVDDYVEIISHLKPLNIWWVDVTIMDLFNIPFNSDIEIIELIKKRFFIDITTQEWIYKINDLFSKAKKIYESRYLKKLPIKISRLKFRNTKSIIDFLRETKTNKTTWALNCAIAKISYATFDVLSNEKVRRESFLDKQFISEYLERPFQIEEWYEDENGNIYRNGKVVINWQVITFRLISRQKWSESIIWKQLSEAKYYSTNEFFDLVWVTVYVENDVQAALMMQYIDQMIYAGKAKIKNKNWINIENVLIWTELNDEFYEKLEKATRQTSDEEISEEEKEFNERKKSSSLKYKEIKLVWYILLSLEEWKYLIWIEIKFVVGWHDNEQWISFQTIYDYLKRFRELTRLWIPIRKIDIINYVNDFFEHIEENLKKKNKNKETYYKELFKDLLDLWFIEDNFELTWDEINNEKILALWLYKYFESKLIKIRFPHSKKEYYFDESILKMRDVWLYKDFEQI